MCKGRICAYMVLSIQFSLIWYATWLLSVKICFVLLTNPRGPGCVLGQNMCLRGALCPLIWYATWLLSDFVFFHLWSHLGVENVDWPHHQKTWLSWMWTTVTHHPARPLSLISAFIVLFLKNIIAQLTTCADPESFARGGPTLIKFFVMFFLMRRDRIQIALKGAQHWVLAL